MAEDIPSELRYTDQHEWVRDDGEVLTIGITRFAEEQLGDVVFVDLPAPGTTVTRGQAFGEVESTKSVSDLYAPVTGEVVARNDELTDQPELINAEPYGQGWLVTMRPSDRTELDGLLDAAGYAEALGG